MSTTGDRRADQAMATDGEVRPAGFGCEAHDLKRILNHIADQIADADRRHSSALVEMQQRLGALGTIAKDMHQQLPAEMTPQLDRIKDSMAALSERLVGAEEARLSAQDSAQDAVKQFSGLEARMADGAGHAPSPLREVLSASGVGSLTRREESSRIAGGPEVDRFDMVAYDEPWDEAAAEALTRLYEDGDAGLAGADEVADAAEQAVPAQHHAHAVVEEVGSNNQTQAAEPIEDLGAQQSSPARDLPVEASLPSPEPVAFADVAAGLDLNHKAMKEIVAQSAAQTVEQEREWLEQRFADIASRLDLSLAGIKPDGAVSELSSRFGKLEESLTAAMAGAATRADLSSLKTIETQVEDLTAQLDSVQTHFSRLDTIELELRALAERISDEKLAKLFEDSAPKSPDFDGMAAVVANRVVERMPQIEAVLQNIAERVSEEKLAGLVSQLSGERHNSDDMAQKLAERLLPQLGQVSGRDAGQQAERLDEIRALVHEFVSERRHGEEQTNTMLDTMQQAMIRLLDRMDALETGQPALDHHHGYEAMEAEADAEHIAAAELEASAYRQQVNGPDVPYIPHAAVDGDTFAEQAEAGKGRGTAGEFGKLNRSAEPDFSTKVEAAEPAAVNREDFIAAARRAARQAASQSVEQAEAAELAAMPVDEAVSDRSQIRKQQAKPVKSARSSSKLSIALLCLIAVGAGFVLVKSSVVGNGLGLATGSNPVVPVPLGAKAGVLKGSDGDTGNGSAGAIGGTNNTAPRIELKDADEEFKKRSGAISPGSPAFNGNKALIAPASLDGGAETLPPIDGAAALNAATAGGQSPASVLFGKAAFDGTSAVTSVPAALTPGAEAGQAAGSDVPDTAARLPPATIGPYSLRHAALKGEASAQFEVAARFAEGKGIQQNLQEAVNWYRRSAAKGFAPAQYRLASMYERGFGVKSDLARAKQWYQRAAQQGVVKAMHNMAVLSAGRAGAAPNYEASSNWFKQAAAYGLTDSQFNLAIMYDSGLGQPRDAAQAYKWFAIAARAGDAEASRRRDSIRSQLPAKELAALDEEIKAWRPRVPNSSVNDMRRAGEAWKKAGR